MAGTVEQFKGGFFDRPAVQNAIDAASRRVLSKFGAYVRTRARTSMRRRKAASAPGSPPSVHSRDSFVSLRNILFAYDPRSKSVVVGPVLLNGRSTRPTVPRLHETGGTAVLRERGKARSVRYAKRPFMEPAYKAELQGKLAAQLRDMIRST